MIEYVFFSESSANEFIEAIARFNLESQRKQDAMGHWLVCLTEEHFDEFAMDIEKIYDKSLDEQSSSLHAQAPNEDLRGAAVCVCLQDGTTRNLRVPPNLVDKLLQVLTLEEYRDWVQDIVHQLETSDENAACPVIRKF